MTLHRDCRQGAGVHCRDAQLLLDMVLLMTVACLTRLQMTNELLTRLHMTDGLLTRLLMGS